MTPLQLLDAALAQAEGLTPEEAVVVLRRAARQLRAWRPAAPLQVAGLNIPAPWLAMGARSLAAEAEHRASMIEEASGLTSAEPD